MLAAIKAALIEEYEQALTVFKKCTCGNGVCYRCYYARKIKELEQDD